MRNREQTSRRASSVGNTSCGFAAVFLHSGQAGADQLDLVLILRHSG